MATRTLSELLGDLRPLLAGGDVTVSAILEAFHERGFGMVLLIFSIPLSLPIPKPPGLSSFVAIPLLILTFQQALGRHTLWLPDFVLKKSVSGPKLRKILDKIIPFAEKTEVFLLPRLEFMTQGLFSLLVGILGFIMTLCIMVPLPGTNTVPALGITLMAAGVIMRDGLCIIAGMMIGMAWVFLIATLYIVFGLEGWNALRALFQ